MVLPPIVFLEEFELTFNWIIIHRLCPKTEEPTSIIILILAAVGSNITARGKHVENVARPITACFFVSGHCIFCITTSKQFKDIIRRVGGLEKTSAVRAVFCLITSAAKEVENLIRITMVAECEQVTKAEIRICCLV